MAYWILADNRWVDYLPARMVAWRIGSCEPQTTGFIDRVRERFGRESLTAPVADSLVSSIARCFDRGDSLWARTILDDVLDPSLRRSRDERIVMSMKHGAGHLPNSSWETGMAAAAWVAIGSKEECAAAKIGLEILLTDACSMGTQSIAARAAERCPCECVVANSLIVEAAKRRRGVRAQACIRVLGAIVRSCDGVHRRQAVDGLCELLASRDGETRRLAITELAKLGALAASGLDQIRHLSSVERDAMVRRSALELITAIEASREVERDK